MRTFAGWVSALVAGALALGTTGCIKQMLLDGQIESTRKASAAVDTVGDYEVANNAAFAGLAQFEGMHYLAPDNENALFMLTKGWAGATFGFIEDRMEEAEDVEGMDSPLWLYQQERTKQGYDRAIHYGVELVEKKNPGFKEATRNDDTMKAWLQGFDVSDVPNLFWLGYAWIAKVNAGKDDPALVAELYVGVAIMERVAELDGTYMYGSPHTILGAYHARSAAAELDESKKHFDEAIKISEGKVMLPKVQLAAKYYCLKGDREAYVKTLTEVVEAGDTLPEQRLQNAIAKRRARRYLGKERMKACGFDPVTE
ncbi:MAG: TRAP transporter TatT component family protein [Polyangiaceae bacterium]